VRRVVNIQVLLKSLTQLVDARKTAPRTNRVGGVVAPVDIDDEVVEGLLEVGTS